MTRTRAVSAAPAALIAGLQAAKSELVDRAVGRGLEEIATYGRLSGVEVSDVREHLSKQFDSLLRAIAANRLPTPEGTAFSNSHISRRVDRVPLEDFLRMHAVFYDEIWARLATAADNGCDPSATLAAGGIVNGYSHLVAARAAERYVEFHRILQAAGEQVRRDLFEELLLGRPPSAGPSLKAAREAGLVPPRAFVVVVAAPTHPTEDDELLRSAMLQLGRLAPRVRPLMVQRHAELVVILPVGTKVEAALASIAAVQAGLAERGKALSIGVSTVRIDITQVAHAYREASAAQQRVDAAGGLVALPALTAFDCLLDYGADTARERIPLPVKQFVADDLASGGVLINTLFEYTATNFNVKLTAERLHVHHNTARYRLAKIEERTGYDLRRIPDVIELIIAARATP